MPLRRARALLLTLFAVTASVLIGAPAAQAYAPVEIVHTEQVQAGPYDITVGFSKWPLRAMQSLDFTFAPADGITGKSGTLTMDGPEGKSVSPLSRHPRKRSVWGLDVESLNTAGSWSLTFTVNGPQGHGTGTLAHLAVLPQPGPPMALSWTVCAIPALAMTTFLVIAWRRHHPSRLVPELL